MEINKKLGIPEIIGMISALVGLVLWLGSLDIQTKTNTQDIQQSKVSISALESRYHSTEQFKTKQESINENQEKFNQRLEQTLAENSKTNQELYKAVLKLQVFLDNQSK
ncbi:MAG: hypothetical protein ACRCVP_09705 [Shewanella xiamenensis]